MIAFGFGFIVGGLFGLFTIALLVASKDGDY
jgi:hypothetical protein